MGESLTAKDLQRLPLRAIVALCARSAARFRAQFAIPGDTPDRGRIMASVDAAIRMACDFAAEQPLPSDAAKIVNAALSAAGEASANMLGVPSTIAGMAAGVALTIQDGQVEIVTNQAQRCVQAVGHGERTSVLPDRPIS
jgi:hypothetical protein